MFTYKINPMENQNELTTLISQAKNVCIIPVQSGQSRTPTTVGESLSAALALFYTLKELGKNVNLIAEEFPEKLQFLVPPLDFISSPKNFVISIPKRVAEISQIYYEKNDEEVKIHVTVDKGRISKEEISFYFENAKPDVIITVGIQDFQKTLEGKLDSFGFLLGAPIINIDNANTDNKKFGQINVVADLSLAETIFSISQTLGATILTHAANALLTGVALHYGNFATGISNPAIFQLCADLVKRGADHMLVSENINRSSEKELKFLGTLLQHISIGNGNLDAVLLKEQGLDNMSQEELANITRKLSTLGMQRTANQLFNIYNGGQ